MHDTASTPGGAHAPPEREEHPRRRHPWLRIEEWVFGGVAEPMPDVKPPCGPDDFLR